MKASTDEFITRNKAKLDRLPTDLARKWIIGLVEHPELQTTGRLAFMGNADDGPAEFCCLGYGCHLFDPNGWIRNPVSNPDGIAWSYTNPSHYARLPSEVRKALGLKSVVGYAQKYKSAYLPSLASMNDNLTPWPEIAQHALDNLEAYFNVEPEAKASS